MGGRLSRSTDSFLRVVLLVVRVLAVLAVRLLVLVRWFGVDGIGKGGQRQEDDQMTAAYGRQSRTFGDEGHDILDFPDPVRWNQDAGTASCSVGTAIMVRT
jgi:hypothetical protein